MSSPLVVLVQPPFQEGIEGVAQTTVGPPLGLAYLAAACERSGLRAAILDANAEGLTCEEAGARAVALAPTVVGTTAVTPTVHLAARVARAVKGIDHRVPVVLGGVHATVRPSESLAVDEAFDFAVRGEGEEALPALVERIVAGTSPAGLPGVAWRPSAAEIRIEPGVGRIDALDALPFPARHLLPNHLYRSPESRRFTTLIATRGCPAGCTYCAVPVLHGQRLRARSPGSVVREIELCAGRFGARFLSFLDDTFTMDRSWAVELCAELGRCLAAPRIRWICLTRVDRVDPVLLALMRAAGCVRVEMGIDAGDAATLAAVRKGIDRARVLAAFQACRRAGLSTMGFAMIGFPDETAESMRATLALVREADPDYLQLSYAVPYPGTPMYDRARAEDLLATEDWRDFVFFRRPILRNPHVSVGEIVSLARRFQRRFFFHPRKIARLAGLMAWNRFNLSTMARTAWKAARHLLAPPARPPRREAPAS